MFNTKNVTEGAAYLQVGVNDDVTIVDINAVVEEGKTPYFDLLIAPSSNIESPNSFRLYFSEKATQYSLARIKHIATKVVTQEQIDNVVGTDFNDYATKLKMLLGGRRLRLLLNGSEYMRNDGSIGTRTELPMMNFAEAIVDGAEYAAVTKDNSSLGEPTIKQLAASSKSSSGVSSAPPTDWSASKEDDAF